MAVVWCTHIFAEVSLTMGARTFLSAQSRASLFVGSGLTARLESSGHATTSAVIIGYSSQHGGLDAGLLSHVLETLGYRISTEQIRRRGHMPRRKRASEEPRRKSAAIGLDGNTELCTWQDALPQSI